MAGRRGVRLPDNAEQRLVELIKSATMLGEKECTMEEVKEEQPWRVMGNNHQPLTILSV